MGCRPNGIIGSFLLREHPVRLVGPLVVEICVRYIAAGHSIRLAHVAQESRLHVGRHFGAYSRHIEHDGDLYRCTWRVARTTAISGIIAVSHGGADHPQHRSFDA